MSLNYIKRLQEQRANVWEQAKGLLDHADAEGRELTAEEDSQYRAMSATLDAADERIKAFTDDLQRAADVEASFRSILDKPEDREAPSQGDEIRAWASGEGPKGFTVRSERPMGTAEFRDLSKLSAGAGGNTVKIGFYERLMAHLIEVSGILAAGPTVLNTTSGEQIQIPKTTAHSTGALTAEAAAISESDPTFGQVPLDAYKYAVLLQVSNELLTDTSVDLEGYLSMQAGRAIGNAFGVHAITGSGSAQPNGVVTGSTLGVTGATSVAGVPNFDNLIDLYHSVIGPYRNSPSCGWLLRDSTVATIRKVKDSDGQYLWQPSLQIGVPDTLLGKPVRTDPNVAATGTSAKSVLFGDFSQYFVRFVNGVRFERSDDYAFNSDLVTYRAILRADGDLVDTTGAVKHFAGGAS